MKTDKYKSQVLLLEAANEIISSMLMKINHHAICHTNEYANKKFISPTAIVEIALELAIEEFYSGLPKNKRTKRAKK